MPIIRMADPSVLPGPWDLWEPELRCTANDALTIATWMCHRKVRRVRVHFVRGVTLQRIQEWFHADVKGACLRLLGGTAHFYTNKDPRNGVLLEYSLECRDNGTDMSVMYNVVVHRTGEVDRQEEWQHREDGDTQATKPHAMAAASGPGRVPRSEYCVELFDSGFMGNMPLTLEDLNKDAYERHGPQNELAEYVWSCSTLIKKPFHEFDLGSVASLQDASEWVEWVIKTSADLKEDMLYRVEIRRMHSGGDVWVGSAEVGGAGAG